MKGGVADGIRRRSGVKVAGEGGMWRASKGDEADAGISFARQADISRR